jgi:nitrogen-specific signal transduction histidine kinase
MTMESNELRSESVSFQWDFYERAVNNYSIIMRILNCFADEDQLVTRVPAIFVQESLFDMCKILREESGIMREGFFSLDATLVDPEPKVIRELGKGNLSPSVVHNAAGYGVLYLYPLKKDVQSFGYVVLGKKLDVNLDKRVLRELEIVCDIYNKALLLHSDVLRPSRDTCAKTIYEKVLEEFPDAMLLTDGNGSICFANKRARKEFEGSRGLFIGENIDNVVSGISADSSQSGGSFCGEVNYRSGEHYKIFNVHSYPVGDTHDGAGWRGVIFRDVVEKKIREEEHLLKEKMESIGMLAGGIAHDFNNLLTGVLGYASLIKNLISSEEKLYRYAQAIENSAQRAAKLTQHLLNFSRRQRKKTGIVDLNGLLDDILFLISESFRDMEVEKTFCASLSPVKGDEAELQNVFLNLCVNAKDAMNGQGSLKVRTDRKRYAGMREYALVEIEDTGSGIDEHIKSRIFEPYFTTKENGTNIGMGLYLVDKVIRDHGGFIELESEKGKGTKFSLYIPLPMEITEDGPTDVKPDTSPGIRKKRILVVDDEAVVREFLAGVLKDEGVQVFEASDGDTAIRFFNDHHREIDVVILDMIMPGIKGDEVLRAIREIRNDARVIISSGYMSEDQRDRLKEYRVDVFLDKPFRDKDVIRSVISVLSK